MQGATGAPGGWWPTKTPLGYLWKRTCFYNPRGHFYLQQTWHGAKPRTPMQSFHKHGEGLSREPWCDDLYGLIWVYWDLLDQFHTMVSALHGFLNLFIGKCSSWILSGSYLAMIFIFWGLLERVSGRIWSWLSFRNTSNYSHTTS